MNVVVLDDIVILPGRCYFVSGKDTATLVAFKCKNRAFDGASKSGEKLTQEHNFLRGGGKSRVFGLHYREGDIIFTFLFLELVGPRDGDAGQRCDKASVGAAVDTDNERGVFSN